MPVRRPFPTRVIGAVVVAAALWAAAPTGAPAHAQVVESERLITNVAQARWTDGGPGVASNAVVLRVPTARPRPVLEPLSPGGPGAPTRPGLTGPTRCEGSGGPVDIRPGAAFAGLMGARAPMAAATRLVPGEPLLLSVLAPTLNRDPAIVDTVQARVTFDNGDAETLLFREEGADTGRFVALITTIAAPPAPQSGDCQLSFAAGDTVAITVTLPDGTDLPAPRPLPVVARPRSFVFDSGTGEPVAGVRLTLVRDGDKAGPGQALRQDGSANADAPASVISGPDGGFSFDFAAPGRYVIRAEPPAPWTAPSVAVAETLAGFIRPDGANGRYVIAAASYGAGFDTNGTLDSLDVPLDRPGSAIEVTKLSSTPVAAAGDPVGFTIVVRNPDAGRMSGAILVTDIVPPALRVRLDTLRLDGRPVRPAPDSTADRLVVAVPALPGGGSARISYVADIAPDTGEGVLVNRAHARDDRGTQGGIAEAQVRVTRDAIADRMTIVGRIRTGGCGASPGAGDGIGGVRVMLPDGRYTATDTEGRYHFEGLRPGTHVVAIDPTTVPPGMAPVDCTRSVRSAGSAQSRFVDGVAGITYQADFTLEGAAPPTAAPPRPAASPATAAPADAAPPPADRSPGARAPGETPTGDDEDPGAAAYRADWHGVAGPDVGFLFPAADHNPRARGLLVAVRHRADQAATLHVNGRPAPALSYEGAGLSPDGRHRVAIWRGVELGERANRLTATISGGDGTAPVTLTRDIHVAGLPVRAVMLPERSRLIADGSTVPVVAVQLRDRDGRPVRHGTTGSFTVGAPYASRVAVEAQAERQLAGLDRMGATFQVVGDDGIALIELEPTLASGSLAVAFPFRTEAASRTQRVTAWMSPGDRPWTLVGFAEGTAAFGALSRHVRQGRGPGAEDGFSVDGRIALHAKGRVRGKWLLTLAYDSDRRRDETRFGGIIEPDAYYTVYADRTATRHDAASVAKLYVRLDRPNFTAAFGDFDTALDETELARYNRAMTGLRAEYGDDALRATAFAAETATRHVRDELQGLGLSGPYALSRRDILPNSDVLVIETRDRLRSNRIVARRPLERLIDYDIDFIAGTVRLRSPLLSRDADGNPQFLVADYETDGRGRRVLNAGGRVAWRDAKDRLRLGATVVHDRDADRVTDLGAVDARLALGAATEIRAELAASRGDGTGGGTIEAEADLASAFILEAEHRGPRLDLLAYVRRVEAGFGVGQVNGAEAGTRKVGLDARYAIGEAFALTASAWTASALDRDAGRVAARAQVEWRRERTTFRAGITYAEDRLGGAASRRSTLMQVGATHRLFDNRLEIDALADIAVGRARSTDFPARHRLSARYALTQGAAVIGGLEWTGGGGRDDRQRSVSAHAGVEVTPWTGGRLTGTMIRQDLSENGTRTYAAYGLAQSLRIADGWTADATLDGSQRLSGLSRATVLDPLHPVASGGHLSTGGALTEDFLAVTAGMTLRRPLWSVTGRLEARAGEEADRYGVTLGAIRQMAAGTTAGARALWTLADGHRGLALTETGRVEFSLAHRPDAGPIAILDKFEARLDRVSGAVAGGPSPVGGAPLTVAGDVASRRVMNSLSVSMIAAADRAPRRERAEVGLFWGTRHVFNRYDGQDVDGWSNILGTDARWYPSARVGLGIVASLRAAGLARSVDWAVGPALTLVPVDNVQVELGYNVAGFEDRDFAERRATRSGAWITVRAKFDGATLDALMGGR